MIHLLRHTEKGATPVISKNSRLAEDDIRKRQSDLLTYLPPEKAALRENEAAEAEVTDNGSDPMETEEQNGSNYRISRYPQRDRSAPQFFDPSSVNLAVSGGEPLTAAEELSSEDGNDWKEAITSEMDWLAQHSKWNIVQLPTGAKPLKTLFVFKGKVMSDGTIGRYKVCLVVKGYMQGNVEQT